MALTIGLTGAPTVAHAADCTTDKKREEVSPAEAQTLYDCIAPSLIEGYSKAEGVPGLDFRDYKLVTTAPLVSATHGSMFVNQQQVANAADAFFATLANTELDYRLAVTSAAGRSCPVLSPPAGEPSALPA